MPASGPRGVLQRARSAVVPKVKQLRDRLDDNEVRQARRLVRALRSGPPDVIAFGDSNWVFLADYDTDRRSLAGMIGDGLGPDVSFHVCAGAGYHPALMRPLVRLIQMHGARPVVIVPLCVRMTSAAWITHPKYSYAMAIEAIEQIDRTTPTWRIRRSAADAGPEAFARYGSTEITTWAGTQTIQDLRGPLLDPAAHGIDETERRRLLYAYHHGERLQPDQPTLHDVEALGRALAELGTDVVAFETTVPVDEGVALWGEQFRENAAHALGLMREAFRRGYGEIDIIESGMAMSRSDFIDPADGSEHLNQHGRRRIADLIVERVRPALERRSR